MRLIVLGIAAAALLAGCSEAPPEPEEEKKADALQPGEYELTSEVKEVRSTDKTTPATRAKVRPAQKLDKKVCVGADGVPPAAFAEGSDKCTAGDTYMRSGRMSLQFKCQRAGDGMLTQTVDGSFTADSFTADVITGTYFSGDGDYAMTRTITGRRVGDCAGAAKQ